MLDPKQFLGRPLVDALADLNLIKQPDDGLQGLVELYGSTTAPLGVLDALCVRPTEFLSTLADLRAGDTYLSPEHPEIDLPGVVLETYIGGGSQGMVYAGQVTSTKKTIAVKVLRSEYVQSRRWALHEADICSRFRHQNILRVFRAKPAGAYWVVLMELVQGQELQRLPADKAKRCFAQLADALLEMAGKRIVHRDVKPGNVLLRQHDESPVLVDFGLAVDLKVDKEPEAKVSGTPFFMAPEAFENAVPDPAWDAYALGVSAVYALAGKEELYDSYTQLIEAKRSGKFERILVDSLGAVEDQELRYWIHQLLDRKPGNRLRALEAARRWKAA